jgi:hypothetical protein
MTHSNTPSRTSRRHLAAVWMVAALAAGCGGAGEEEDGSDSTSSGGGSGSVASYESVAIPGYASGDNLSWSAATNRGFYVQVDKAEGHSQMLKLHGNPQFNDWSSATMEGHVTHAAPANASSEADRAFSFYWTGYGATSGKYWGLYTGSGVSSRIADNMSFEGITAVAAGALSGITRPWVVSAESGGDADLMYVWQDDGAYAGGTDNTRNHFGTKSGSSFTEEKPTMLAHPSDGRLFVGANGRLRVHSSTALVSQFVMPTQGLFDIFTDMVWHDGELWFGYGGKVYRLHANNTVSEFTALTGAAAAGSTLPGRFCIKNGDVLTTDGMARRISDGYTRSFISSGSLSAQQSIDMATLTGALQGGIYCAPENMARAIYTPTSNGRVMMIFPLN